MGKKTVSVTDEQKDQPRLKLCVEHLDKELRENSGIILYRGYLWTINDHGGKPELYAFNPQNGKVIQVIHLKNARNKDWEDIAQDSMHIYIGDFGNNNGKRQNLRIYILKKNDIPLKGNSTVKVSSVQFSYTGKPNETSGMTRSAHDCEAFFAWNDTLYIFTKNRKNQNTILFKIPSKPGKYIAQPVYTYLADGLITGADISINGDFAVLSGYKDHVPFVIVFYDIEMPGIFKGKSCRLEFKDYFDLQVEGVAIRSPEIVFIASERSSFPPQLYSIDVSGIIGD